MASPSKTAPKTVWIVAVFLLAATVIAFIVGFSILFPNPMMARLWKLNPSGAVAFLAIGRPAGLFLVALGVGTFAAAQGLLRGQKWAWWFSVSLFAVDGLGDLVSLFATRESLRSVAGMMISLVFLYCLTRPQVRRYFNDRGGRP